MRKKVQNEVFENIKVLVLDDEDTIVQNIKYYLNKNGFSCEGTTDYEKAIEIVKNEKIDILIIDYLMIGVTAVQVIDEIRQIDKEIYIILLTGHANVMPPAIAMQKYDIDSFCEKTPGNYEDLLIKVYIAVKSIMKYNASKEELIDGRDFSDRLKYLRTSNNLTQDDLAGVLGVVRSTIANYESGVNEPTVKHLRKLAEFFKVSFDYLLSYGKKAE